MNKILLIILILLITLGCNNTTNSTNSKVLDTEGKMIATKVYKLSSDSEIIPIISEWKKYGITDAFVLENLFIESTYQTEIKNSKINSWVITQMLYNDNNMLSNTSPNPLFAITDKGTIAADKEWLEMVCPNGGTAYTDTSNYKLDVINRIKKLVTDYNPYGISLDFMRYFVFWEKVYEETDPDSIPNTCFCDRCLSLFSNSNQITIPDSLSLTKDKASWILDNHKDKWTNFKITTITNFVKDVIDSVQTISPDIKFNIHGVPWRTDDFDGAIKSIAGQDYKSLGEILDYISPMCYAKMLHREPAWINSVVADISKETTTPIVPVFQVKAMYGTSEITDSEFDSYIVESLKSPSSGVAFWPWESLTASQKVIIGERLGR